MSKDRFGYAWQKAYEALTSLTGTGSFDERLRAAAWGITQFPSKQVPLEAHRQALVARRAFTMYPGQHPQGAAAGLIPMLPDSRKSQLASKVVALFEEVARLNGAAEAGAPTPPAAKTVTLGGDDEWEFLYWGTSTMNPRDEQDAYVQYAQHYLPNFPREVLLEWIGRHGYEQMRRWKHVDLRSLRFEKVEWTAAEVARLKPMPHSEDYLQIGQNSMGACALSREGDWLAQQLLSDGTWPYPVVVIENDGTLSGPSGAVPVGKVLVEGHRRVSLLLNTPQDMLKGTHTVWLARSI